MQYLMTVLIFGFCFFAMALGLVFAKKVLRKGCSTNPDDCACRKEGKDPSSCDN